MGDPSQVRKQPFIDTHTTMPIPIALINSPLTLLGLHTLILKVLSARGSQRSALPGPKAVKSTALVLQPFFKTQRSRTTSPGFSFRSNGDLLSIKPSSRFLLV